MKKLKKFFFLSITAILAIISINVINHATTTTVQAQSLATKYGRGSRFTIPKSMRGTWVAKGKSAFSKIKLTAHTARFTAHASSYNTKQFAGTWKLYHMNQKWYSKYYMTDRSSKANRYADKHHWLAVRKDGPKNLFFDVGWTLDTEKAFFLKQNKSNAIKFENTQFNNYYYRK